MAIVYDTVAGTKTGAAASLGWNHTIAADANFITIHLSFNGAGSYPTDVAVTVGGVAAALIDNQTNGGDGGSWLFYLKNPGTGVQAVAASWTNSAGCVGYSMSLKGVGSVRGSAKATATSDAPSVNVASAVDDLVIDCVAVIYVAGLTLTEGAGQTERVDDSQTATNVTTLGVSTEPGAGGNVTMSWALNSSRLWATVAASLTPLGATAISQCIIV